MSVVCTATHSNAQQSRGERTRRTAVGHVGGVSKRTLCLGWHPLFLRVLAPLSISSPPSVSPSMSPHLTFSFCLARSGSACSLFALSLLSLCLSFVDTFARQGLECPRVGARATNSLSHSLSLVCSFSCSLALAPWLSLFFSLYSIDLTHFENLNVVGYA